MSVSPFHAVYKRLNRQASAFSNMPNVVKKLNTDNAILEKFYKVVLDIFHNEMKFTHSCNLLSPVLTGIQDKPEDFDIKEQLMDNLNIFKENFKLLTSLISRLCSCSGGHLQA